MDWTTALGCLGKYALIALAIFGIVCIISIQYSRRLNAGVKAAVEQQPKPKQGRVLLREVVEGMHGMADSYIAEVRDHGSGDTRFHIYDVNGNLIVETQLHKCLAFISMTQGALCGMNVIYEPRDKQAENDLDLSRAADESDGKLK